MNQLLPLLLIIINVIDPVLPDATIGMYGVSSTGFDDQQLLKELMPLITKLNHITGIPQEKVLPAIFGDLEFTYHQTDDANYSCWATLNCYGSKDPLSDPKAEGLLIHELGHRFMNMQHLSFDQLDLNIGFIDDNGQYIHVTGINPRTGKYERTSLGYPSTERPYMQHPPTVPGTGQTYSEDFADMFMAWALNRFSTDTAGVLRYQWMDRFVRTNLREKSTRYLRPYSYSMSKATFSPLGVRAGYLDPKWRANHDVRSEYECNMYKMRIRVQHYQTHLCDRNVLKSTATI